MLTIKKQYYYFIDELKFLFDSDHDGFYFIMIKNETNDYLQYSKKFFMSFKLFEQASPDIIEKIIMSKLHEFAMEYDIKKYIYKKKGI